jgi:hypothetical protein
VAKVNNKNWFLIEKTLSFIGCDVDAIEVEAERVDDEECMMSKVFQRVGDRSPS